MKKFLLTIVSAIVTIFLTYANDGIPYRAGNETKKQVRKEKREERRELWSHSVNIVTEEQFHVDFPNAKDVSWNEGQFAEATFYDNDILKTAFYNTDNELVGTTTDVDYSALPGKAKQYINKKYGDYTVEKVVLFDDNEAVDSEMVLFSNSFKDKDTYFPLLANGSKKIILKVTKEGVVSFFHDYK